MAELLFAFATAPTVTVVIPAYGQRALTSALLVTLEKSSSLTFEVIVVDNASPDDTREWLAAHVQGIQVIENERNVGFGAACNQAALSARGEFLCFLNSDTEVRPGWLDALVAACRADPSVGACVGKLLNVGGSVQAAGAVVGGDATTQAVGAWRTDDPLVSFPRDVDYGTGACLLVRRRVFLSLGGFDLAFGTAYYEDVDLAFALRRSGYRVVYEPRSEVLHHVGASSNASARGPLVATNQAVFKSRWASELATRGWLVDLFDAPPSPLVLRDAGCGERLLVLSWGSAEAAAVDTVLRERPDVRVTVAARLPGAAADALARRGVEVFRGARLRSFLRARRYHYSDVAGARGRRLQRAVARWQPQASVSETVARFGRVVPRSISAASSRTVSHP